MKDRDDAARPRYVEEGENMQTSPSQVVIVGLSTIRKLLNGEDVHLPTLRVTLIPDDDLWNAKRRADWVAAGCPDQRHY